MVGLKTNWDNGGTDVSDIDLGGFDGDIWKV